MSNQSITPRAVSMREGVSDMTDLSERRAFADALARDAGALGLEFQRQLGTLAIESKGPQDFVTEADRAVERLIREAIGKKFPDDAVLGEEYGASDGTSGFVWVIDPIDGTANFIAGLPLWCVSIACFVEGRSVVGAIHAPVIGDTYTAAAGGGTTLNGAAVTARAVNDFRQGSIGVGFPGGEAGADSARRVLAFCQSVIDSGGVFVRPGSGALLLADVAAGRLIAGVEPHMNAWDCLAGLLMIEEAGGRIEPYDGGTILQHGARIIASGAPLFDTVRPLATEAFDG